MNFTKPHGHEGTLAASWPVLALALQRGLHLHPFGARCRASSQLQIKLQTSLKALSHYVRSSASLLPARSGKAVNLLNQITQGFTSALTWQAAVNIPVRSAKGFGQTHQFLLGYGIFLALPGRSWQLSMRRFIWGERKARKRA